jgi:alkylhydroperoxidase/carboxymuconolactone decarboxylase family protein YurZ
MLPFIESIKNYDPKFYQLVKGIEDLTHEESTLDPKTKLMISLAVDACTGATEGVAAIAGVLRKMGVTDEQIGEVLRLTYFAQGNTILATSMAAFRAPQTK